MSITLKTLYQVRQVWHKRTNSMIYVYDGFRVIIHGQSGVERSTAQILMHEPQVLYPMSLLPAQC